MTSFGDTKLRNLGDYFAGNISRGADPMWQGWKRIWNSYRAKYVTCKNARMTPFLHIVFLSMALNYAIDYPHLKGKLVCFQVYRWKTSIYQNEAQCCQLSPGLQIRV